MKNLFIIGAGASGMMAAISASMQAEISNEDVKITVLENESVVGRKILVTGNGKCNLSNKDMSVKNYHCKNTGFIQAVFNRFDGNQTVSFFECLGLMIKEKNGYLYPNTLQASSVTEILLCEMLRRNISLHCNTHVVNVIKENGIFKILTSTFYTYEADAVIFACGSPAGGVSGADASGYTIAAKLGHNVIPLIPSLVQLRSKDNCFGSLAGIRINATVTLLGNEREYAKENGEIQITDYGVSGIPVFQLSGTCAELIEDDKKVELIIDFLPDEAYEDVLIYLRERMNILGYKKISKFLTGMFPEALCNEMIKRTCLPKSALVSEMEEEHLRLILDQIKRFYVRIYAVNPLKHAQVARGGIDIFEIDPDTMSSRIVEGLYFAGELVDVDGRCGGYNLQWAWSSGFVAGVSAVNYLK